MAAEAEERVDLAAGAEAGTVRYVDHLEAILAADGFGTKGDRTRFRLKIAAAGLLEELGCQDLKVSDICRRAEVALGTFYVYFPDKAAITGEVLLDFGHALYSSAETASRGGDAFAAIHRTNTYFVDAYRANAGLVRCLVQFEELSPEFRADWRDHRLQWLERIARSLDRRAGDPSIQRDTYLEVAFALEGMVFHYLYDAFVRQDPLLHGDADGAERIVELLSVLWYRAVYCENPPGLDSPMLKLGNQ